MKPEFRYESTQIHSDLRNGSRRTKTQRVTIRGKSGYKEVTIQQNGRRAKTSKKKLSKKEIPLLKLDLSCSIYSLTTGGDTTRVLNWDGVDIMFWLVLYDSLKLYDPIRKNVSRALRNFSSVPDEGRILVKEDKFLSEPN